MSIASRMAAAAWLVSLVSTAVAQRPHPASVFVERGALEMRTNPEASRRDAESALEILKREPNADLEIRARLLLCDYYAERDTGAARQEIAPAMPLLPRLSDPACAPAS